MDDGEGDIIINGGNYFWFFMFLFTKTVGLVVGSVLYFMN